MHELPGNAVPYAKTKVFSEVTLLEKLLNEHDTKAGTRAVINVIEGSLDYVILDGEKETIKLSPNLPGIVSPQIKHFLRPDGPVQVYVEFYKEE